MNMGASDAFSELLTSMMPTAPYIVMSVEPRPWFPDESTAVWSKSASNGRRMRATVCSASCSDAGLNLVFAASIFR